MVLRPVCLVLGDVFGGECLLSVSHGRLYVIFVGSNFLYVVHVGLEGSYFLHKWVLLLFIFHCSHSVLLE